MVPLRWLIFRTCSMDRHAEHYAITLGNGTNPQEQIALGLGETHARGAWPDVCFVKAGE